MIKNVVFIEGRRDGYDADQIYKNTMTVGELVNYLTLNFDTDALVMLCNDNGYTYGTITEDGISDKNIRIAEDEED